MKPDHPTKTAELRHRAEARLQSQKPPANAPRPAHETQRLLLASRLLAAQTPWGRARLNAYVSWKRFRWQLVVGLTSFVAIVMLFPVFLFIALLLKRAGGLLEIGDRNSIDFPEQVSLNVRYIESQSFGRDLLILAKTVPAILFGKGR